MAKEGLLATTLWFEQVEANYSAPKARLDSLRIMRDIGISVMPVSNPRNINSQLRVAYGSGDVVSFVQYPLKPWFNITDEDFSTPYKVAEQIMVASTKTVLILHDIKHLQATMFDKVVSSGLIARIEAFERFLFSSVDAVICHSSPMSAYLESEFGLRNVVSIVLFDYLCSNAVPFANPAETNDFVFAGYLGRNKRSLVRRLSESFDTLRRGLDLYGPDFDFPQLKSSLIRYMGSVHPDLLPSFLAHRYLAGIIWDELNENQRTYYRLIAPHKASAYLAAGLPIVAPRDTYIGDFVSDHSIGFSIDDLSHIGRLDDLLGAVDFETLRRMQIKVRNGHHLKEAIKKVLE
ncbi:MAG: hypothetical protein H6502_01605 [Candidatus Woesearchaeota archaeon]|nr:MAG: hypothetical protein H6502_01605 [Candidatus Woesearchaeota archaeon]